MYAVGAKGSLTLLLGRTFLVPGAQRVGSEWSIAGGSRTSAFHEHEPTATPPERHAERTPVGTCGTRRADRRPDRLTGDDHWRLAGRFEQERHESFERSDTDGFPSQWASGLTAQWHRLATEIADLGGRHEFPALFDGEGHLAPPKLGHSLRDFVGHPLRRR
jgi:hypothetical protein